MGAYLVSKLKWVLVTLLGITAIAFILLKSVPGDPVYALPLARVMAIAADHYYATHEPFGPTGDFVTAPEISQMFGELVGLWLADIWQRGGSPAPVALATLPRRSRARAMTGAAAGMDRVASCRFNPRTRL